MLAPMIREKPAAIEKNAVAEGMSRMRGKEVKSTLQHQPNPASLSSFFAITHWPIPKKKRPLQPKRTLQIFPRESYPAKANLGNSLSQRGDATECTRAKVQDAATVIRASVRNY